MAVIEKNLGPVSAYAVAVANGYEGTEEQWAAEIAAASQNAQAAAGSATEAAGSAAAAAQSVTEANAAKTAAQQAAESASAAYGTDLLATTFSADAAYTSGQYVIYNGGLYVFTADHPAGAWIGTDARRVQVGGELTDLKSAFEGQSNVINSNLDLQQISAYATSDSYRLLADGNCVRNSQYELKKYSVKAGNKITIRVISCPSDGASYQFQTIANVPTTDNDNIVGTPKTVPCFETVIVPDNAEFLILSRLKTERENSGAYTYARIDSLENEIWQNVGKLLPMWNISPYGIYIDGTAVVVNQNGFRLHFNGLDYYIAPIDATTITTFNSTGSGDNDLLVLDTSVLNAGGRTNPSDCIRVYRIQSNNPVLSSHDLVIAVWNKGFWEFTNTFDYFRKAPKIGLPISQIFTENHLIAHKGGDEDSPNTLRNIESGIANGYKIIEVDVRFTSDLIPVLSHDATFTVGGVTYTIASETYASLISVKPDLATLKSALLLCKKKNVCMDIDFTKEYSTEQCDILYEIVMSTNMAGRCIITAYSQVCRYLIIKPVPLCVCVSGVNNTATVDGLSDITAKTSLAGCSTSYENITEELINYMHIKGFFSKPWTVDDLNTCKTLYNYGADFIITNNIKESEI